MKKLTETEVARFKKANIISEGQNWWTEYPEQKIIVSEENLINYLGNCNEAELMVKIAENDLAGKRGRFLFNYSEIPGIINF